MNQKPDLEWIAVAGKGPQWLRSAAIDSDGTIYAPGVMVGEMQALLCASYDGTPMILDDTHAYFPTPWLMREFPETAEECRKIERRVKECIERTSNSRPAPNPKTRK